MADEPTNLLETVDASKEIDPKQSWLSKVFDRFRDKCGNCGSSDHLKVKMIVPEEAGGLLVESNGIVICRTCEMATDTTRASADDTRRPINFWVSKKLHQDLQDKSSKSSLKSMASMVRYLMTKFVEDPERFDDLSNYQDTPESDLKINVWVEKGMYASFKQMVDDRGWSVTEAVKSLIIMYQAEGKE